MKLLRMIMLPVFAAVPLSMLEAVIAAFIIKKTA